MMMIGSVLQLSPAQVQTDRKFHLSAAEFRLLMTSVKFREKNLESSSAYKLFPELSTTVQFISEKVPLQQLKTTEQVITVFTSVEKNNNPLSWPSSADVGSAERTEGQKTWTEEEEEKKKGRKEKKK